MQTWASVDVPRLAGGGPPLRLHDTATGRVRPTAPGADRHDVRLRHHPLRRHPPRPRRHLPGVRPGQPAVAGPRATTCTTCRTSPTSTTRCSSAPPATRTTGWCSACGRRRCSARTWRRCGCCRRGTTSARSRRWAEIAELVAKLLAAGRRLPGRRPGVPRRLLRRRPSPGTSATSRTTTRRPMLRAVRASAAATRTGPASGTRSTRCCGGWRATGEPSWESRPRAPGRPGWHVECAAIALNRLGTQIDLNGGGSDLIFPHHECGAAHAEALHRRAPVRPALHARRDDRAGRREDVQVPRQPGVRVQAAGAAASTRTRSAWPCWPGTTAPTAPGPTSCSPTARGAAGPLAGGASPWTPARPPTDLVAPAAHPPRRRPGHPGRAGRRRRAGRARPWSAGGTDAGRARRWSREAVDALLGDRALRR